MSKDESAAEKVAEVKAYLEKRRAELGEEALRLRSLLEFVDLIMADSFSKLLGLKHSQLAGRKILCEYNPTSNYERTAQDFTNEALANAELVAVFTRVGSPIHLAVAEQKALRMFLLTPQVSAPTSGSSENEMLLPLSNTDLMLAVFDKMLKEYGQGNISIVFDSLSDLILSIGFEKTHSFMRYLNELLASIRVKSLFLLNPKAHEKKHVAAFRGLFNNQVAYGKWGLRILRLPKTEGPL